MSETTFQQTWLTAVEEHADRPFLIFRAESGAVSRWTYGEFDGVVTRVAGRLRAGGVRAGSPVHLVLRNCPGFVAVWLAAARLGAWIVPVDPASAVRDVASQVRRVKPVVGICAVERAAVYHEGADGAVPLVIEIDESESDVADGGVLDGPPDDAPPAVVAPTDRMAVMFTSGTTSEPKGVDLTQRNYAHVAAAMADAAGLEARHRWYVTLPLFHANAPFYCFAPAIARGASVALLATFTASGWVAYARELEVTHASLFAAPIRMILARTPEDQAPAALEHVWFAQSLGAEHHAQFGALVGVPPRQLYGMTETTAIVCFDPNDPPRNDVIGRPLPGRRIRLDDPVDGTEAETGTPGELVVLGVPGDDLFAGYLDDPDKTGEVFDPTPEGTWFSTGDLVSADAEGTLRFVGRVDDVIKVSGENVSLTEVEAAVAQAPGVLEVAVIAQPDPIRDVVPVAYVVARDPASPPSSDELTAWAERNLSPAARPRSWSLIDELPRTSVGKVRRFRIGK
ncbi:AMP-binding protein [Actinomycetospora endophytica]|uniref:AMP-binding protein n=1 Tax=Actinomycetospora endophytica TaxID=2291215 RepID=A0ABS8PI16_9PSEU|nr:AMP-binding protein [Actinomycetospora endophytica]MCD2197572.1 AMP-binding protein [Actinomycetospora endophytica]